MYVYKLFPYLITIYFAQFVKCTHAGTHLPTARQYKVLFRPSTAVSVAAGISLHAGAFGVPGSVCPNTKYTILCKIIFNPCFML